MIEQVIALLMIIDHEIKEHRIQPNMSECLKGKRIASRTISCLLYTSPSPRDRQKSRMPSSA